MLVDFVTGAPTRTDLDVSWIHGSPDPKRRTDPPVQVHALDPHTFVLRQSKDDTFEAPFVFLLFGNDRALLLDTGAVHDGRLRATVDDLVSGWLADHPRDRYDLVVAHTHGHGDHVAGDTGFRDRPGTTVVGRPVEDVIAFFGFSSWPTEVVPFDLGGRILEVTGIPGHHPASIAIADPWTGALFTGDSVLPGRLYIADFPAFLDSLDRLVALADARSVRLVLGCHIEMTRTPGRDYFPGCRYQPDEPPLQLTTAQLHAIRAAARSVQGRPGVHRFDDVIIYHGMGPATFVRLNARGLWGTLWARVRRATSTR